ncbi:MAG: type II secretion system protein M [Pirellulales bacterium]|nr:type II secretion system protein M [Pirellulales bacterium]
MDDKLRTRKPGTTGANRRRPVFRTSHMRLLLITAAMCACYTFFVHLPARKEFQEIKRELASVERELTEASMLPSKLADAVSRRDAAREYIANWKDASPDAAQAASFGAIIAQIVSGAGARTDRLQPQTEIEFESLDLVPITLEFDGYFHQACDVLSKLEARTECIWIDELLLENREEQSSPRLHCLVKLAVFADKLKNSD